MNTVDLLRIFPFTDAGQTVELIDLGTPQADALLRAGWSAPATLPGGASGAWAIARRATVQFVIARPADGSLVVRCGLLGEHAPRAALLTVGLNGWRLGLVRVGPTLAEHTLRLPARYQPAGTNMLRFSNALLTGLPRRGERQWTRAVAFDWLRMEEVHGGARPSLMMEAGVPALVFPAPSQVDFFVRLPPRAELEADVRTTEESSGVTLRVTLNLKRTRSRPTKPTTDVGAVWTASAAARELRRFWSP